MKKLKVNDRLYLWCPLRLQWREIGICRKHCVDMFLSRKKKNRVRKRCKTYQSHNVNKLLMLKIKRSRERE